MKRLLNLSLALSAILLISTSAVPHKRSSGFYVQNGTTWNGTITGYGAIYTPSPVSFGTTGVYFIQSLSGATYLTVTITSYASGTHTYGLTGGVTAPTPVTTASGSVTFTNVPVTSGDINAYIH